MKKKAELMQKINAYRKSVLDLLQAGNVDEAKKQADELDKLMKDYDSMPADVQGKVVNKVNKKQMLIKAVNSYLHRGWAGMSDEDRALLTPVDSTGSPAQVETTTNPSRGSVFVPFETADFTEFMSTGVYRLRTRVSEYVARTLSGRIPLANNPSAGLVELFDEYPTAGITKKDIKFGSVDWAVKPYGAIVPVSNQLMEDANQDVMAIIAEIFFRAQVITENNMILTVLDGAGAATSMTDWTTLAKAVNEVAPVGNGDKIIITNTDGWNYLDTLVDDNGLPILTVGLQDSPKRTFKGYEVVQLPTDVLPNAEGTGAIPFYAVSPKDAVVFVERKGLELFYNPYGAGFEKDATEIKVTCRMDAKLKFANAVKKLAYTPA